MKNKKGILVTLGVCCCLIPGLLFEAHDKRSRAKNATGYHPAPETSTHKPVIPVAVKPDPVGTPMPVSKNFNFWIL